MLLKQFSVGVGIENEADFHCRQVLEKWVYEPRLRLKPQQKLQDALSSASGRLSRNAKISNLLCVIWIGFLINSRICFGSYWWWGLSSS